jgi:hypothetical protein
MPFISPARKRRMWLPITSFVEAMAQHSTRFGKAVESSSHTHNRNNS